MRNSPAGMRTSLMLIEFATSLSTTGGACPFAAKNSIRQLGDKQCNVLYSWHAYGALASGDMLLIDSSHIAMPGSDVDLALNLLLPRLTAGVLVHFHDVFLPDAYPGAWGWRAYNEQVALAPLLHGGGYRLLWSSHYLATRHADRLQQGIVGELPLGAGAFEGSLWLERTAAQSA